MSDLANYHNDTVRALNADEASSTYDEEQGIHYDSCAEIAVDLLANAGYTPDDTDDGHQSIDGDVQTLLTLAMFRAPRIREYVEHLLEQA